MCGLWSVRVVALLSAGPCYCFCIHQLLFPCLEVLVQGASPYHVVGCKVLPGIGVDVKCFRASLADNLEAQVWAAFGSPSRCQQIPSNAVPKVCPKSRAKKIQKSVVARTHPCLKPLQMSKGLEELPLNCTVPFMFVWKDSIMLCNFGGQPIFGRIWKRPSLLTRSNAFVRSMKAIYRGICCSLHFSWSWRREKTGHVYCSPSSSEATL